MFKTRSLLYDMFFSVAVILCGVTLVAFVRGDKIDAYFFVEWFISALIIIAAYVVVKVLFGFPKKA